MFLKCPITLSMLVGYAGACDYGCAEKWSKICGSANGTTGELDQQDVDAGEDISQECNSKRTQEAHVLDLEHNILLVRPQLRVCIS